MRVFASPSRIGAFVRGLAAAALLVGAPGLAKDPPRQLDLESLSGDEVAVELLGAERPVVAHFWATWCPPCDEELATLARAMTQACRDEVRLVAISVEDEVSGVLEQMRKHGDVFEWLRDPEGRVFRGVLGGGLPSNLVAMHAEVEARRGPLELGEWVELLAGLGCRGEG